MSEMSRGDIRDVCVFCSASAHVKGRYLSLAQDLAELFERKGWALVYGGASGGLMGDVADAALARGVFVRGVITAQLKDREVAHGGIDELIVTRDMHERQMKMAQLSQAFIVLPGGLGTLAEFFEVVTWQQLGLHSKPIILFNDGGYWDDLLNMLGRAEKDGFLYGSHKDSFHVLGDVEAIANIL